MKMVKFGDVANRLNIHVDQATTNLEYYIGGEHIESCEFMIHNKALIKGSTIGYQFQFGFRKGDILFMTKNPHLRKTSMVDFDGLCSIATFVIHSKDESVLLQDYLLIEMQSDRFWNYLEEHKSGGVNYFINWGTLSNYEFPLPPLEEQKVLADKLWAAYRLKESYKKLLAATEEMVKSQFIEMFGDPIKNTKKLLSRKGEELFVFSSGKANTKSNLSNDFPYNCYGGNGITGHSNQWLIDYPTIVIGRVGEYCGCVHKTQGKVWITDNAIYIKEHKKNVFDDAFLFYLMTYLDFHRLADETGQPKITQRPLLDMEYIIPSKDLQQKFISIAEQADKSGFELRKSIDAIDAVIKSLINSQ